MRFLILHVDSFASTITERGRSKVVEPAGERTTAVGEALVVLTSVEKGDERNPPLVAGRAAAEIAGLAGQLKVQTVVLHPFAHLFAELARPEVAVETLALTAAELARKGLAVIRTPFGWFNTLEVRAKGHPLSRVARVVTADESA